MPAARAGPAARPSDMSRSKPSPSRLPHPGPSAWLWIAAAAGVAAGLLVATTSAPIALIALVVAAVGTALILRTPEIGLLTLVFAGYVNLSDVLIEYHGGFSLTKLLVPLVLVAVLLRWVRQRERPEGWLLPALLVSTYGFVCVLSLLAARDPRLTLAGLTELAKNGMIFILVATLVRNAATLRRVLWTLIAAAGLLGTIAVHQQLTGNFDFSYWGFGRASDSFAIEGQSTIRLGGPVGDPNFFGMMLLAAVPLALDRLSVEKKWGPKIVALWALLVSALAIVFTYSRSALLSFLALLVLFAVVRRPRPAHLLAAALVALLLVPLVPGTYSERLLRLRDSAVELSERGTTGEISVRGRLSENLVATEMFLDHPVIGVGLADYPAHYLEYSRRLGLDPRDDRRDA